MDKMSIAGILIAILSIYLGFMLDGGNLSALFELPAFIIVDSVTDILGVRNTVLTWYIIALHGWNRTNIRT